MCGPCIEVVWTSQSGAQKPMLWLGVIIFEMRVCTDSRRICSAADSMGPCPVVPEMMGSCMLCVGGHNAERRRKSQCKSSIGLSKFTSLRRREFAVCSRSKFAAQVPNFAMSSCRFNGPLQLLSPRALNLGKRRAPVPRPELLASFRAVHFPEATHPMISRLFVEFVPCAFEAAATITLPGPK